jgi:hypothetical protein
MGLALIAPAAQARDLIFGGAPILPPRTQSVPDLTQWNLGVLSKLMTQLQDHGYKAMLRNAPLQNALGKTAVEVIETGVNGANVEIAALPCDNPNQVCALSFKAAFTDNQHVATEAFCVDVQRQLSLARVIPVTRPDGGKGVLMVYVQLYDVEPDFKIVETALNTFGADIGKFRSAYRAGSPVR